MDSTGMEIKNNNYQKSIQEFQKYFDWNGVDPKEIDLLIG